MKRLFWFLKDKIKEEGFDFPVSVELKRSFIDKFIVITIGWSNFVIEERFFEGYEIKYHDGKFNDDYTITTSSNSIIDVWQIVFKLIWGSIKEEADAVNEIQEDYRRFTDIDSIKEVYQGNEEDNYQFNNALLLAMNFGSEEDVQKIKHAMAINGLLGYMNEVNDELLEQTLQRLYPKLEGQ